MKNIYETPGYFYHVVQESSAAGIWRVRFVKGKYNIYDLLNRDYIWYRKIKTSPEMDVEEIDSMGNQRYIYCLWILKLCDI